jgi:DNA-binding MarR family transcriptional regulator
LHNEQSPSEQSLSSPNAEELRAWRLYFESSLALLDVLEHELQRDAGIPVQWYDVFVQLEDEPDGLRMVELADRILYSKAGLTRVIDRMEKEDLVRRVHRESDRRSIFIVLTDHGLARMLQARRYHRHGIEQHFASHLTDADTKALTRALEKVSAHIRPLRPGRIQSKAPQP